MDEELLDTEETDGEEEDETDDTDKENRGRILPLSKNCLLGNFNHANRAHSNDSNRFLRFIFNPSKTEAS